MGGDHLSAFVETLRALGVRSLSLELGEPLSSPPAVVDIVPVDPEDQRVREQEAADALLFAASR